MAGESVLVELLRVLAALLVVVPAAYLSTRLLGGRMRGRRGGVLKLVDSLPLGPQRGLHLVQVGERLFLIGSSERQISLLAEMDQTSPVRLADGEGLSHECAPAQGVEAARLLAFLGRGQAGRNGGRARRAEGEQG